MKKALFIIILALFMFCGQEVEAGETKKSTVYDCMDNCHDLAGAGLIECLQDCAYMYRGFYVEISRDGEDWIEWDSRRGSGDFPSWARFFRTTVVRDDIPIYSGPFSIKERW